MRPPRAARAAAKAEALADVKEEAAETKADLAKYVIVLARANAKLKAVGE